MTAELDRITQKVAGPQGHQYALTAAISGNYPNVRGGTAFLNVGEVWKYGETTSGDRYSQKFLTASGLKMQIQFLGNQMEIKVQEKIGYSGAC